MNNAFDQRNPMQMIVNQVMNGMSPSALLNKMSVSSPQIRQAKTLISGKNQDQLRDIATNMAAQRGIDINNLAQQLGIQIPK